MATSFPSNTIKNYNHFFQIRRIPLNSGKNYRIQDVFNAINNFCVLTLDSNNIKEILLQDLQIPTVHLKQPLLNVLEEAVLYYCKEWDGWNKPFGYYKNNVNIQEGITGLKLFVSKKCNFIVRHADEYIEELKKNVSTESEKTTDAVSNCPYKIVIGGSPSMLNNMVVLMKDDDIIIKLHEQPAQSVTSITEFLNLPFVSVEIKLLDLHIKRTNCHNFQRYISKVNQKISPFQNNFILDVVRLSNNGKPYTRYFFWFYFIQLFQVLDKIQGVNANRVKELQTIYTQFMDDIREMNIAQASMCSDTSIKFNIGGQNYARSKQMVVRNKDKSQDNVEGVNFVEYITPQIELTLFYCTAIQDLDDVSSVTFKRLNSVNKRVSLTNDQDIINLIFVINSTCIEYTCTFCNKKFSGERALKDAMDHFNELHKLGHPLICIKCQKQCDMITLSKNRWKHECS